MTRTPSRPRRRASCARSPARRAATSTSPTATGCGSPSPSTAASSTPAARARPGRPRSGRPSRATRRPPRVVCLQARDKGLDRRARLALQRRGCRSLAWAPMLLHGELVGALELSDAGERDFSRHADVLEGLARVCAEASRSGGRSTSSRTATRCVARARRPLAGGRPDATTSSGSSCASRSGCSPSPTPTASTCGARRRHDPQRRQLHARRRRPRHLATRSSTPASTRRSSSTLLDHTPLAINDLRDQRLGPGEAELMRGWGYASSLTHAARRRRRPRRTRRPLRRRRARLERRPGVPHQRLPARRRRVRQLGAA